MSNPEREFWNSFDYNHETNVWGLTPGLGPMDILEVCRKKLEADRASVDAILAGPLEEGYLNEEGAWVPKCDHAYCTCESECERCSKCGATI